MQAALIFLGSFLLFLVQPMLGRTLLPVFGGSASVWGVCLAVFQALLVGGYFYAHKLSSGKRGPQLKLHATFLLLGAAWLFASAIFRGHLSAPHISPWLSAALWICLLAGIPYTLLSAGSTLVQASAGSGRGVYRLYAVSNAGSLLGLLAYPFAVEPFLGLSAQWFGFAILFLVYAALFFFLPQKVLAAEHTSEPSAPWNWRWFALPGLLAFALNATVAHLFIDVTPVPLIWTAALALFLLAWIFGFSKLGGFFPKVLASVALLFTLLAIWQTRLWGTGSFWPNAICGGGALMLAGTCACAWLYKIRPATKSLTRYYLATALGGASGGMLASFAAPMLFSRAWEYPIALVLLASVCAARFFPKGGWCGAVAAIVLCFFSRHPSNSRQLFRERNFYGSVGVTQTLEQIDRKPVLVSYLWYGQTTHGLQVRDNQWRGVPFAYYSPAGAGAAVFAHPKYKANQRMNVGVIGLGAGMLALYGREGDLYRFFEINPLVIRIARDQRLFTFLADAPCGIDLIEGDARTMLEKETAAGDPLYDVLFMDAYSGDAVPYHLATEEAFRLYLSRLAPEGILAVHISNWHIDLKPLCKALAEKLGLFLHGVETVGDGRFTSSSVWVFLSRVPHVYPNNAPQMVHPIDWNTVRDFPAPTDEKGSILPLLNFH